MLEMCPSMVAAPQKLLPLSEARERCMECHDLDNSPDFHKPGAFDEYWSQVEHYGVD